MVPGDERPQIQTETLPGGHLLLCAEATPANRLRRCSLRHSVIALSPTHTGLGVATWALIARGITPLREDDLTNKVGAVNDKALTRIDDAIRMLYEL